MGMKKGGENSILGSYACSACHDVVDGRVKAGFAPDMTYIDHLEGMVRTIEIMIKNGVLKL